MADKTNVYNNITALRRETAKNAISPNVLGSILKSIVDLIDGTVNTAQLDPDSGDNGGSSSPGFNGGIIEDDTYSPLIVSSQTVQLEPDGSCTLTYNRLADEVVLSAYDENLITVVVQDGTITIVAASLEGATNFTLSDENGSVGEVQVLKSLDTYCDREAKRVVQSLPRFTPGRQQGKPVKVWFQFPIRFEIQ